MYDNLEIGQLLTANYLKNQGEIASNSFKVMYKTKYRDDKNAQDDGVINDGDIDNSQVFEIVGKN